MAKRLWGGIRPCPNCKGTNYDYAASFRKIFSESASKIPAVLSDKIDAKNIAKIILKSGSGYGIFSIFQIAKNAFEKIPEQPLLRCKKCQNVVMTCIHCDKAILFSREPGTGERVECPKCEGVMSHCEGSTNPFYDYLGANRQR